MNDYQNRVLECALAYIQKGWKVLPLHTIRNGQCACGKANCSSPGKHPSTANGSKDASCDEADIRRWFSNGIAFNIGIATGSASGLAVLDVDPKNGGDETVKQFTIPPTMEVVTGSGGRHYYFTIPQGIEIRNSQGKLAAGIDVRGENGYVVAPPSLHASGNDYRWAVDPRGVKITECPKWIYENKNPRTQEHKDTRIQGNDQQDDEIIIEGQRNGKLSSIAGAMRRQGCDQEAIFAALININQRQCKPPLSYDELKKIAASIAQYQPQAEEGIVLDDDHHVTVAKAFEAASPAKHRHQTETWIVLQDKKYQLIDERELKKQLRNYANECKYRKRVRVEGGFEWHNERLKVTPQLVNGILEALSALESVWLSPEIHSPVWIGNNSDTRPNPEQIIPVQNCLLDISGNEPRVLDLTDEFFAFNYLPIVYDPKANCPLWIEFLGQIFQTKRLSSEKTEWDSEAGDFVEVSETIPDELSISILQEFMGLLLTQITRFQKILGIVGPKRSGKGTIGRIIRALVGKDNIGSPTLTGMTNEHGLQGLYHKTVALISDASISGGNADTVRAVERLKSISGEDSQQINPKCKAHIEVDRMKVRFVIMSNELQKLTDPTGALAGRFIYLITTQSFFGKEDVRLEEKLLAEIPGIFNWAIEGLMRLLKRGYFQESAAGLDAKAMAEELGSPVIAFVREYCEVGANRQIRSQELYDAYKRWCQEAGRSQMGRNRFYEEFQRAFPDCSRSKIRQDNIGTSPVWVYGNIALMAEYRTAGF
jgi:putative DNA primase/helicase